MAVRTSQEPEEPQPAEVELEVEYDDGNRVTRPADLGFGPREIVVDPIQDPPPVVDDQGFVQIRMAETVEEFTYGNPNVHYRLEAGKIYRMPVHIAAYLNSLGKLYHR